MIEALDARQPMRHVVPRPPRRERRTALHQPRDQAFEIRIADERCAR
jgi:hypothetical protein